jgi:hypothetical protein
MRRRTTLAAALLMLLASACGSSVSGPTATPASPTPDLANRPSSPALLQIVEPTQGQMIHGTSFHVMVSLQNAHVVQATSTNIKPDEGHVHLYLDNALIYMQYSLQQDVPAHPGTYTLKAEFVGSDHFPFNPRVFSQSIVFTVT